MKRSELILREVAKALHDQRDPFSTEFLLEHDVTFEECSSLSMQLAAIVQGYLVSDEATKQALIVSGSVALEGSDIDPATVQAFIRGVDAIRRLRAME